MILSGRLVALLMLVYLVSACGGSSSARAPDGGQTPPDIELLTGVFINAPVIGLGYRQGEAQQPALTAEMPAGQYQCDAAEPVHWQLGALPLGVSDCRAGDTSPVDLVCAGEGEGGEEASLCAVNMARFLQLHGADDADTLRISEQARNDAQGLVLDFTLTPDAFAAQFEQGGNQAYLAARNAEFDRHGLPSAFEACQRLVQGMLQRHRFDGLPDCAPLAPAVGPQADAGPDQTALAGDTVVLDGQASAAGDAALVSIAWVQRAGAELEIDNSDALQASVNLPLEASAGDVFVFELTLVDEAGLTDSAETRVTVVAAPNMPPVADAGPDQTVTGGEPVTLDGTDSADPDGDIVAFAWTQQSGPAVMLDNADTAQASFDAPLVAETTALRFRLTVTDNAGAQASDSVTVTVLPRMDPPPPEPEPDAGSPALLVPVTRQQCDDTVGGFGDPGEQFCEGLFTLPNMAHNECVQLGRPLFGGPADLLCDSLFSKPMPPAGALAPPASCADGEALEGGRSYPVYIASDSGETIAFQVLEPLGGIDCDAGHALVLHGHGFGGSRSRSGFNDYREAGFTVISIDARGFGESSGTVRVMDPDFEGRDLIRILDWAEDHLDYLLKRDKPGLPPELNPNLVVGAMGGSYGGGYQMLLHGLDPKQRLDALVPDITWYDLRYSLNPGNVIKTGWDLFLVLGGEAGSQSNRNGGLDPVIRETLVRGLALNRFPQESLDFFYYNSPAYRCNGEEIPERGLDPTGLLLGLIHPRDYSEPPTAYPAADVLITQGMRDTLFNFNEAWRNFECLRERGGDVRLLTHQSGHILPLEFPDDVQPGNVLPPPLGNLLQLPGFQGAGGGFACGDISVSRATRDWLRHTLQGEPLPGYFDGTDENICLSLADGASVLVPMDSFLAPAPDALLEGGTSRVVASAAPVPSGVTAVATLTTTPEILPLGRAGPEGAILGGIPTALLTVSDLLGRDSCAVDIPLLSAGCDPAIFIGLGRRSVGDLRWRLIDDQIKPVRGLKRESVVQLVGIAEQLAPGDELALLVYGFHLQYPASWSRDALVPFVNVAGTVQVPLLAGSLTDPGGTPPPPVNLVPEVTEVCGILGLPLLRPICQQVDNLVDTLLEQCAGPLDPACGLVDDLLETVNGLVTGIGLTGPADLSLLVTGADALLRGCDVLDPEHCLYPFPSNHFTATVPAGTPTFATGRRVAMNPLAMPRNLVGKPIDPTDWNRNDGFSPGQLITTFVPDLDLEQTYQAPLDQLGIADPRRSLTEEAFANGWGRPPVLVLEVVDEEQLDTREHLVWVEQDVNAELFLPISELFGDDIDRVGDARSAVLIRPAKNFTPGRRYVVVMRDLRNAQGQSIAPSAGFQVCRDQLGSSLPTVQGRCAALEQDVFPVLEAAGIHRDSSLYLAWDFTVASTENITGRLVHMRDDAFASLSRSGDHDCLRHDDATAVDCAVPRFTVDTVDLEADNGRIVKIDGSLLIPSYLLPADTSPLARPEVRRLLSLFQQSPLPSPFDNEVYDIIESASLLPPNRLHYSPVDGLVPPSPTTLDLQRYGDGLPDRLAGVGDMSARYTCEIPRAAFDGQAPPARAALYGHGLLQGRVALTYDHPGGRSELARNYNTMFCSLDWFGFAQGDLPNILLTLLDLSNFGIVPDASQQGMLNWMFLARVMLHPDGFASHPAFRQGGSPQAGAAFERSDVFYYGNSQGGILPGPVQAVSPDINRGVYGVPGMNYSLLLRRSKDFTLYSIPLYLAYPDELDRNLAFALIQMLWDRGENSGFAAYLTERDKAVDGTQPNLSGTDNYVLLHTAFADQEVTHWSVDMMARTMGAPVDDRDTLRYPGLNPDIAPYYDIPRLQFDAQGRASGSANIVWVQPGVLSPPLANIPPTEGPNPHGYPRGHGGANCQIHHFLQREGFIADVLDYSAQRDTQVQRCLNDFGVGEP
ncbi:PKD domain-containing protein [Isoalcanivorax indicus]|uniref:PKD domain-containing protein n=1 Tax=Isoalcanivorax indicus TaxID=2202653 RepID=UPI000DBA3818|nr:CocE/NonD family hydrolase [Isoalcanivorax indicus]